MALTAEKLLAYLNEKAGVDLKQTHASAPLDAPLFTSSLLDSYSLIDLIMFVETELGVKIEPDEVRIENFDSASRILQFASSKTGNAGS